MTEPWDRRRWRLGVKLGSHRPEGAVGWAAIEPGDAAPAWRPPVDAPGGVDRIEGDPVEAAVRAFEREASARPGCEGAVLYLYGDPESFAGSRAAAEGMTRTAHSRLVRATAERLRAKGVDVEIVTVRDPRR